MFHQAADVNGDSLWTWLWLSRAALRTGALEESRNALARAVELVQRDDDRRFTPCFRISQLHLAHGDADRAREWLIRLCNSSGLEADDARRMTRLIRKHRADLGLTTVMELSELLASSSERLGGDVAIEIALLTAIARHEAGDARGAAAVLAEVDGDEEAILARLETEIHDPLSAWKRLTRRKLKALPDTEARALVRGLLRHGYLSEAVAAAEAGVAAFPRDTRMRDVEALVRGEHAVLSGRLKSSPHRGPISAERSSVLHVVGKSLPYADAGYTFRTHYIVTSQHDIGLRPSVVTKLGFPWSVGAEPSGPVEMLDGVPHYRIGAPQSTRQTLDERVAQSINSIAHLIEAIRPEVVHAASDYLNGIVANEVGYSFDLPVVYEARGFWEETWLTGPGKRSPDSEYYRLRRERELECMERADRVVTLSEIMRDEIAARGVDPGKIHVVANAVDPGAFPLLNERPARLAERWGIAPDDVTVGYISSFSAYEGIDTLVRAVSLLRKGGERVKCILVGDGKERGRLERLIDELGLGDHVIVTGRVPHDEVLDYYGLIDVFVVPRTNERVCHMVTPLKPFEAMATGRALVVSRTKALESLVEEGQTGLTFTPEDPADLAERLAHLAGEPETRRRLGENAHRWVVEHHTWEQNARRYLDLYASLGVTV